MNKLAPSILFFGVMSAAGSAQDLSRYRTFQFGDGLTAVAAQAGMTPSQAKEIHRRPALLQELTWRPQALGSSTHSDPAKDVVFSFYDGELYRIAVSYDRHETEGLTTGDLVEAISVAYGVSTQPAAPPKAGYGEQEEIIALWQDPQYRFSLIRSSYQPEFKLVGILKRLEDPAQSANIEAARLDAREAPQKEAERITRQNDAERARLEQARLLNKSRFRP